MRPPADLLSETEGAALVSVTLLSETAGAAVGAAGGAGADAAGFGRLV